ncbi:MAG: hypothetical protein ACI8RD_008223 [Bacillariaceae sp.]|jgi:hypothetical protein
MSTLSQLIEYCQLQHIVTGQPSPAKVFSQELHTANSKTAAVVSVVDSNNCLVDRNI